MSIDLDYTARAIAEADPLGPLSAEIDYDDATEVERRMYRHLAHVAREHAHRYAVHTVLNADTLTAIFAIQGEMDVIRNGDRYDTWGEPLSGNFPDEHIIAATSDEHIARALVSSLNSLGQPSNVTPLWDWADDECDVPTEWALGLTRPSERVTYADWSPTA